MRLSSFIFSVAWPSNHLATSIFLGSLLTCWLLDHFRPIWITGPQIPQIPFGLVPRASGKRQGIKRVQLVRGTPGKCLAIGWLTGPRSSPGSPCIKALSLAGLLLAAVQGSRLARKSLGSRKAGCRLAAWRQLLDCLAQLGRQRSKARSQKAGCPTSSQSGSHRLSKQAVKCQAMASRQAVIRYSQNRQQLVPG